VRDGIDLLNLNERLYSIGNMMEEKEKKTLTTCSPEQLSENHLFKNSQVFF